MSEDSTRPISVAELLARNGTIGSPPVSGHRRRKRRDAVSVAELTGEIPIAGAELAESGDLTESVDSVEPVDSVDSVEGTEFVESVSAETVVHYSSEDVYLAADESDRYTDTTPDYTPDYTAAYSPDTAVEVAGEAAVESAAQEAQEKAAEAAGFFETTEVVEVPDEPSTGRPPRSSFPLVRRRLRGPERSHDPRPRRRSQDAEQMTFDPVDQSVDLSELVDEQVPAPEEVRSYMQSSSGTLFSGETVADDLARRGLVTESEVDADRAGYAAVDIDDDDVTPRGEAPRRGAASVMWGSAVAILQSLLAVVFGAALFIAFDQLWQWNNIVALALSTLVIVALVVGVHLVRKTEDFVSILIAVAVGILVTFGPLALQSS